MGYLFFKRGLQVTFLFWGISLLFNQTIAQSRAEENITLRKGTSVMQALQIISNKSGYEIFGKDQLIANRAQILLEADIENASVNECLVAISRYTNLKFKKVGKTIFIGKRQVQELTEEVQQEVVVSGTVTSNEDGQPLPGVTILVKGTGTGTSTDLDGNYKLTVPEGSSLIFSFIGFQTQEVAINNQSTINIVLQSDVSQLEEVVVVGYGTQKKVNLTGSVATVSSEELASRPVSNISSALQGAVPGMTIVQNSGQPGKDAGTIRVRGVGTIGNSAGPMVLVDGIESSMNDIDPNDIESISVLKDAASAAIYGSRAANGVILITTKKGKAQPMQLSYSAYIGWQNPTRLPEKLSSAEYAELYNEALANEGKSPLWTDQEIQKFRDGSDPDHYPNTDWLDLFYQGSGFQQNHNVNLNGGTEQTKYMFSFGYFGQEGVIKNSSNDRYNFRTNFNSKVGERLDVGMNLSFSLSKVKEPTQPFTGDLGQIFRQINRISPWIPYKHSDGTYGYAGDGNPLAWMDLGATNNSSYHRTLAIFNATYKLAEGLSVRGNFAYKGFQDIGERFIKDIQYYDFDTKQPTLYQGPNEQRDYRANSTQLTMRGIAEYEKTLNKHYFKVLVGAEQEYYRFDKTQALRKNFLNNQLGEIDAGSKEGQQTEGSGNELAMRSFFGRVNYDFDGKYLLEANLRYDASSRFPKNNRWGAFPSFSAGWRISEEMFMKGQDLFTDLKLRASWGMLGNQGALSYYPYAYTFSTKNEGGYPVNYNFGGKIANGAAEIFAANSNVTWESTETYDIGVDMALLKGKLTFSADYFYKYTHDILMELPVSPMFALKPPTQNAGEIKNTGWEFQAGYKDSFNEIDYRIAANISFIENEVTNLRGIEPIIDGYKVRDLGLPVNSYYGYEAIGIFQSQDEVDAHATQTGGAPIAPGDIKYKDQNGDGKIDGADRVYLGSWDPKVIFGLNLGLAYKGFDLTAFFQGAADVKGYLWGEAIGEMEGYTSSPSTLFRDRWTPENPDGDFPRVLTSTSIQNNPSNTSSFWVKDASYVRLKNLQLGYTFSEEVVKSLGLSSLRVYYSGQNLMTITSFYKGFDPEAPAGSRGNYYPQVKTHSLGVNVKF
ncbi:TonB-dependent receptor [Rapidithrix thailandica]|uniref:TonB-dependent receptor n=1 Tax=Rapidithrix thailandica TaxID=413964 RepID=A0AAW9SFE4_9BACT